MSIEVDTTSEAASGPAPALEVVQPNPTTRLPRWRQRRFQIAAGLAVVALIAGFLGNNLIARQYTPDGVVRQYLGALQAGDASSAWSVIQVSAPAQPAAVSLTDKSALQAALAIAKPDIRSFAINATSQIDPGTSSVDFSYDTVSGSKQAKFVAQRSAETHLLLYQGWRVVITPTMLEINLPNGAGGVAIDGKALALPPGKSTVAVLPIAHRIQFAGTDVLAAQTLPVDAFFSAGQPVAYQPKLTSAGTDKVKAAVKAFLANCAQNASLAPDKCPQSYSNTFANAVQWQLVGDPTQDLAVGFDQNLNPAATGHFQMVVAYQEPGITGNPHDLSAGGYAASLLLGTSDVTVNSISSSNGVADVPRPAGATDQAAKDLVTKAFTKCAVASGLSPADCPQVLLSGVADNVRWKLMGDPLAGALVSFDSKTGILTVHGAFEMTPTFTINGYASTSRSYYDHYYARLLWDGQALQLVTIVGGFS